MLGQNLPDWILIASNVTKKDLPVGVFHYMKMVCFFLSSVTGLSNDAQQYDLRLMGIHVTSKFSPKMRVKVKVWTKKIYW